MVFKSASESLRMFLFCFRTNATWLCRNSSAQSSSTWRHWRCWWR